MSAPMDAIAQIVDYRALQADDGTLTPAAQKQRVSKYSQRISEQAKTYLIDSQIEAIQRVGEISAVIAKAFEPADAGREARKSAILEDLAALPRAKRDSTIRQALLNNDREVIEAIATRPFSERFCIKYVYGECKEALARLTVGDDVDVLKDLQDGLAAIENATHKLDRYVQDNFIAPALGIERRAEAAKEVFLKAEFLTPEDKARAQEQQRVKQLEESNNEQ